MTRVLLLFAATPDPAAALAAAFGTTDAHPALEAATGSAVDLDVVTWLAPVTPVPGARTTIDLATARRPPLDTVFARTGVHALRNRLATFPAGRLLNSLGPADAARTFWRAFRADSRATALAGPEVVVIAGDLAATRAAWNLLRSQRAARALVGLRAAADELVRERAE